MYHRREWRSEGDLPQEPARWSVRLALWLQRDPNLAGMEGVFVDGLKHLSAERTPTHSAMPTLNVTSSVLRSRIRYVPLACYALSSQQIPQLSSTN